MGDSGLDAPSAPDNDQGADEQVPGDVEDSWATSGDLHHVWETLEQDWGKCNSDVQNAYDMLELDIDRDIQYNGVSLVQSVEPSLVRFVQWSNTSARRCRVLKMDNRSRFIYNIPGLTPEILVSRENIIVINDVPGVYTTKLGRASARVVCPPWALVLRSVVETECFNGPFSGCENACAVCQQEQTATSAWSEDGTFRCNGCLQFWHECCHFGAQVKFRQPKGFSNHEFRCAFCVAFGPNARR